MHVNKTCPCLRGVPFDECCGPFLAGTKSAPTAEHLMRSRYSAFSVGDADYLVATWHSSTAPNDLTLDPLQRWYRLDILDTHAGGIVDTAGTVEFSAYFRHPDGNGVMHESSRFVRVDGAWVYLDGVTS